MEPTSYDLSKYMNELSQVGQEFAPMIVKAMILLVIVLFFTKFLGRFFSSILIKLGVPERRATLSVTVLHVLVLAIAGLLVLNLLGFPGVLLFRIIVILVMSGLALFIIVKPYIPQLPFKKQDTIMVGDKLGKVEKITFMHTILKTFDAKVIFIPNHKILNDQVINYAVKPNRRVDLDFFIPYDQDFEKVKNLVTELLIEHETILEKPKPRVVISKFTPNYRQMQARFWVVRTKALTGRWAINEAIDKCFSENGITMASPRLEISEKYHTSEG